MTGKQLAVYVAFCIATVVGVEGYLIHKVFKNEAARAKRVTITDVVPTNIQPRCPKPKVLVIKCGQIPIG